jgi:serine phosphatase RsbU (regulator of sigma subunit)
MAAGILVWVTVRREKRMEGQDLIVGGSVLVLLVAIRADGTPLQWLNLFPRAALNVGSWEIALHPLAVALFSLAMVLVILRQLLSASAERQRLRSEMEAARAVQKLLIPEARPADGITAVYTPAQEVGGDFWQALPLQGGGRLVAIGDVSGKGLKAAMMVSLLTGALRNRRSDQPRAILRELNAVVAGGLDGRFVTAAIARIDKDGRAWIATAGHPAPYLDGVEVDLDPGFPLGIDAESEYSESELRLGPGQQLTFVSDGVAEAQSAGGELFGFERVREISVKHAADIAEAARAWGQTDDITVVTVRRAAA